MLNEVKHLGSVRDSRMVLSLAQRYEPKRKEGIRTTMKRMPKFKNEDAERKFWAEHDSTEYVDWSKAKRGIFPHLKPSTKTISLRLPQSLLEELKLLAHKRDVPYQSLLKIFLAERVEQEFQRTAPTKRGAQGAASSRR